MTTVIKNGFTCTVQRDKHEPYEIYAERCWFVASQKISNDDEYENVVKFSKIWANHKRYGCSYSDEIMQTIHQMEQNMFSK